MKASFLFLFIWTVFFYFSPDALSKEGSKNPIEVGDVEWGRNYQEALIKSRASGKPLFLLFQEVPGCIGCKNFGQDVLTHPLLVEAIEDEFIPVLVFNNRSGGLDVRLLQQFKEPGWNYQVIRFVDSDGKDLIPRRDKIWTVGAVAARMIEALKAAGRSVPLYLGAIALENNTEALGVTAFSMACFWTGEYKLGKLNHLVTTEAGWYDHREVTLISYDKKNISLQRIVDQAIRERCAQFVYITGPEKIEKSRLPVKKFVPAKYRIAPANDQKKQIQQWLTRQPELHLSPMQLMKLNSFMVDNPEHALSWLSPRQLQKIQ